MTDLSERIAANLARIQTQIAVAAARSGRSPSSVKLVAATKYVDFEKVRAAIELGCVDLGESRPQDIWSRSAAIADLGVRWHLIGHLQRNKIRRTLPLVSLIHSVDSERLLAALEPEAAALGRSIDVLLEVKISADPNKTGFEPGMLESLLSGLAAYPHVQVRGLMGMAGLEEAQADPAREFAALRELRDRLGPACPAGVSLGELSMGMSGDFIAAIEQGATLVRIGSALFSDT